MIFHRILDLFFLVFHTSLILFNLFGWIWKRTRLWNLITLLLTASSWLFLGLITGSMGYCPLTDWHFNILESLGKSGLPVSYVKYLADRITGLDFNETVIDAITLWGLVVSMGISIILNIRDWLSRRIKKG